MKYLNLKTIINGTLALALLISAATGYAQVKKAPAKKKPAPAKAAAAKFGALAIDRDNGFYYGWSFDYTVRAEAEKKALDECTAKGGSCTIVLVYSGTGCAAYRTVDGSVGTAYGWGVAKTKEAADAIAMQECLKRSKGRAASNFVWACNSGGGALAELYNASGELFSSVKIGSQIWMAENLNVTRFQNGDPIREAKTSDEWMKLCKDGVPAYIDLSRFSKQKSDRGKVYNDRAVFDKRGLAPKGWHIPTEAEWVMLNTYAGGMPRSAVKLCNSEWIYTSGNNSTGFNAAPCSEVRGSIEMAAKKLGQYGVWWSTTTFVADGFKNPLIRNFYISSYDTSIQAELGSETQNSVVGLYVRCVKD